MDRSQLRAAGSRAAPSDGLRDLHSWLFHRGEASEAGAGCFAAQAESGNS